MSNLPRLNQLLKNQSVRVEKSDLPWLLNYAENVARIENVTAVVSDLRSGTSRIFPGKFGILLGIGNYGTENSIWEKAILDLMTEDEREENILQNCGSSISCVMYRVIHAPITIWCQSCA